MENENPIYVDKTAIVSLYFYQPNRRCRRCGLFRRRFKGAIYAGLKGPYTQGKWSGSVEYVYRHATKVPDEVIKKYTYRLVAGLDYKLTDGVTFKFNFGTNFDGNTKTYTDPKKMFVIGGLNFGLEKLF